MVTRPDDAAWRTVPMRHGDPLAVHPLDTGGTTSVLFARFTAGWVRHAPVRCTAAEEFVVLDGTLELNGSLLGPASVAHVPAGAVRATTTSATGCIAVAWFAGAPTWEDAAPSTPPGRVLTWQAEGLPGDVDWATPLATWTLLGAGPSHQEPARGDVVDLDEPAWSRLAPGESRPGPSGHRLLLRAPREG